MAQEWQTFVRKYEDMKEGLVRIFIKDLTPGPARYDTRQVRATVSRSKEALPGAEILWVRGESGLRSPEPYYIKIHEVLDPWVPGKPWQNVFEAIERLEKA